MLEKIKGYLEKFNWTHVVLVIAASAGLYFFTLDQSELESKKTNTTQAETSIKELERKINETKEFEKQIDLKKRKYTEMVKNLQHLQGALPKKLLIPELLNDILAEAKTLELEVTGITADPKEEERQLYAAQGLNLEAKGTFIQILVFMDRLAHMKRLISIESFEISKAGGPAGMTLGGDQGAFAATGMGGGRQVYPGMQVMFKLVTYRYLGNTGGGG